MTMGFTDFFAEECVTDVWDVPYSLSGLLFLSGDHSFFFLAT